MKRHLYPDDWEKISLAVRDRASGQCECTGECGLHRERRCEERNGEDARWARGRVVLTAAHLCRDRDDCNDHSGRTLIRCGRQDHLKAMCQRCHLRYDNAVLPHPGQGALL